MIDFFKCLPCFAHPVRLPCLGILKPSISEASSLKMFTKLQIVLQKLDTVVFKVKILNITLGEEELLSKH